MCNGAGDLKENIKDYRADITRMDQYHREDIKKIDEHHREDMKQVNENMAKINDRWIELFKQFHILDKK